MVDVNLPNVQSVKRKGRYASLVDTFFASTVSV